MCAYETVPTKILLDTNKITKMTGKDGTVYVRYRVSTRYNTETHRTESVRTSIGKVCEDDSSMMYPNENWRKHFGLWDDDEETKRQSDAELKTGDLLGPSKDRGGGENAGDSAPDDGRQDRAVFGPMLVPGDKRRERHAAI